MRRLITGLDAAGRSCLVAREDVHVTSPGTPGFLSAVLAETTSNPPPGRPPGRGLAADLGVAPGLVRWVLLDYEPGTEFPMHHSDTIDYDILLEGSLVLGLEDGEHQLEPGDVVIMNGVDHSWRAGPDGARLSVLMIGTPPPA
jgi:quercetin dioxygenase-like cupin family protein